MEERRALMSERSSVAVEEVGRVFLVCLDLSFDDDERGSCWGGGLDGSNVTRLQVK